jgi:uncharacterized protein DUF4345
MGTRIFLAFETLVWLPYGIYCFIDPAYLAGAAGVAFQSPTGSTELGAMYGGLQAALGVLAVSGALRASMTRPALLTLAFLCSGLGSTRLLGVLRYGGLSGYTVAGLAFEVLSAAVAIHFLRRAAAQ